MYRFATCFLAATMLLLATSQWLQAAPKHLFKIASLAPAGSVWVEQFENFAKEVTEKTGGEVGFRVYPGGVMGDDQAMFRKIRVGQLHGGGFTMTGMATMVPDFRVLALPSLFASYDEVDHVIAGLLPAFGERFRDKELELVAVTEVGFICEGDQEMEQHEIEFQPVPVETPTVLSQVSQASRMVQASASPVTK